MSKTTTTETTTENIETRAIPTEVTVTDRTIRGVAVVFNAESRNLGGFKEIIRPEAVRDVDFSDTKMFFNHRTDALLGRTSAGTLRLNVTPEGIAFELDTPDTTLGRDVLEQVKRGDLRGCSFAMTVEKDSWNTRTTPMTRNVEKIGRISEISIVIDPAYEDTTVSLRCANALDCFEEFAAQMEESKRTQNELKLQAQAILESVTQS